MMTIATQTAAPAALTPLVAVNYPICLHLTKSSFHSVPSDDSEVEAVPEGYADDRESAVADVSACDSEDSQVRGPRAAAHTHTAWQNDYFALTDNRNYPDIRMRVKDRWVGVGDLGRSSGSKT